MLPFGMERRICQWASALAARPALDIEAQAKAAPDRLLTPWLWLLAARSFAPTAVYEAFKLWDKSNEPHAPVYREFWRGVCEFVPSALSAAETEMKRSIGQCAVAAEDAKRFLEALTLEREERYHEQALRMYLELSSTHALAAAQASYLGGCGRRLDGWNKYRGPVNTAVVALQCLAIGRTFFDGETDGSISHLTTEQIYDGTIAMRVSGQLGCTSAYLELDESVGYLLPYNDPIKGEYRRNVVSIGLLPLAAHEDILSLIWETQDDQFPSNVLHMFRQESLSCGEDEKPVPNGLLWLRNRRRTYFSQLKHSSSVTWLMLPLKITLPTPLHLDMINLSLAPPKVYIPTIESPPPSGASCQPLPKSAPQLPYLATVYANEAPLIAPATVTSPSVLPANAHLLIAPPAATSPARSAISVAQLYANVSGASTADFEPALLPLSDQNQISSDLRRRHADEFNPEGMWRECCIPNTTTLRYSNAGHLTWHPPGQPIVSLLWSTMRDHGCDLCLKPPFDPYEPVFRSTEIKPRTFCRACLTVEEEHLVPVISLAMPALSRHKITESLDSLGQYAATLLLVPIAPCPLTRKMFLDTLQYLEVVQYDIFIAAAHLCLSNYFYGRLSKGDAEALVLKFPGSFLLRWSATMAGVYFIVVSDKEGKGVRHIRIDRADEEIVCNHRGGRRVAVMMPREDRKHGEDKWERRVYDGLYAAIEAIRRPFKLMQPMQGSPYYALMEQRWSNEEEESEAKMRWGTLERKGNYYDRAV